MPLPSDIYDRDYFLSDLCEGWDRFREDRSLSPIKQFQLRRLGVGPGLRLLDAGCGRGEVLLAAARAGAEVAGIDYAEAAVPIARETLADVPGAEVRRGDVTALPWPDGSFDRLLFGDVIEHLDRDQADEALREFHRVLRPGGRLLVHTSPNRLFLQVAWPLARPFLPLLGRAESAAALNGWIAESKRYHVNEQTLFSLRRALRRAGFKNAKVWIDPNVLRGGHDHHLTRELEGGRLISLAARIAGLRPLRLFLGNDLYALGVRQG